MRVERLGTIGMPYHRIIPIAAVPPRRTDNDNSPLGGGKNRIVARLRKVNGIIPVESS